MNKGDTSCIVNRIYPSDGLRTRTLYAYIRRYIDDPAVEVKYHFYTLNGEGFYLYDSVFYRTPSPL